MSEKRPENFIIVGLTLDGKKFRPSDWAERLCGIMSAFGAEDTLFADLGKHEIFTPTRDHGHLTVAQIAHGG